MIVCASCGGQNSAGAAFCGDCGAFLEWTGAAADDGPAGEAVKEPMVAEAAIEEPAAVLPGEAVRRRTRRPAAARRPVAEGEVACPGCAAGNEPNRRFCRSCGIRLAAAPPQRRSWWRRLLGRLFRRRTYAAGTRRRVRRRRRIPRRLVALGMAAVVAGVAAGPGREVVTGAVDRVRQEVRDQVDQPAPVTPTGWEASSARPDHGPDQLSDRVADTFWAPEGDPSESWVEAELPRPVRVLHLIIYGGQSPDPELFQQQARPHEVEVTAITDSGEEVTAALVVRDQPGSQRFALAADEVVRVRFVFQSAHGMEEDRFLAVGEIEFFSRA